jgi:ABC-type histidine transport system ATPase subunit
MQVWDMMSCRYINGDVLDEFGASFSGVSTVLMMEIFLENPLI